GPDDEILDCRGAPRLPLGGEAVVDDPHGLHAPGAGWGHHLCAELGHRAIHLHAVLSMAPGDTRSSAVRPRPLGTRLVVACVAVILSVLLVEGIARVAFPGLAPRTARLTVYGKPAFVLNADH